MTGKHEVALPTINDHQVAHHLGDEFADWLRAEWGYLSQYGVYASRGVGGTPMLLIETDAPRHLDDADTPTQFWCIEHTIELGQGVYEVDYV